MPGLHSTDWSRRLASGASLLAVAIGASFLTVCPAVAQGTVTEPAVSQAEAEGAVPKEEQQRAARGLDEIVVTARKVSENLQDVPVSITAFSGSELAEQNALSLSDVQRLTPSLLIRPGTLSPASLTFAIRGQVNIDALASVDPSVGVYIDGVYVARAYGIDANLLDIQCLQVLKGPQGTLFGRNTTGGAILIQTNDPELDEYAGKVSATYGRFDYKSATAIVNLPLVTDKVALRAAVEVADSDGYHTDLASGEKSGEKDRWNARIKLLVKPTETLSILLSADGFGHEGNAMPWFPYFSLPTGRRLRSRRGFMFSGRRPATATSQRAERRDSTSSIRLSAARRMIRTEQR